jgi:hypothetical protein
VKKYTIMYRSFARSRKLEIKKTEAKDWKNLKFDSGFFLGGLMRRGKQPKLVAIFEES